MLTSTSATRRMLAVLGLGAALAVVPAAQSHAAASAVNGPSLVQNADTKECLDADEAGELFSNPCENKPEMTWHDADSGRIANAAFSLCLQDFGNGDVRAVYCSDDPRQDWQGNGRMIESKTTRACLTNYGSYIYTSTCDDGLDEQWDVHPA